MEITFDVIKDVVNVGPNAWSLCSCEQQVYLTSLRRPATAKPTRPMPNKASEAGSGTTFAFVDRKLAETYRLEAPFKEVTNVSCPLLQAPCR